MQRFNPYTEAISNARAGMSGLLQRTPPPPDVEEAIAEYDRRVADPQGALPEWIAIFELHGPEGVGDYLQNMKRMKETWGL